MRFTLLLLALSLLTSVALAEDDRHSRGLQVAKENKSEEAVALLSDAIKEQPDLAEAYYWRGRELFRTGEIDKSLADFDKFVMLKPQASSSQWERGITCYYAAKFEGRRTASGERFDNDEYTAAHRTLPFGTKVKVTSWICVRAWNSAIRMPTSMAPPTAGPEAMTTVQIADWMMSMASAWFISATRS